jgi:hypothetical protein
MVSSFEPSIRAISSARLERGFILRFRRGEHIVEMTERITEFGSRERTGVLP